MPIDQDKKITIKDVAQHANVSQATVSRVLNNNPKVSSSNRERVMVAIDELEYKPNYFSQALASNRSSSIGMVVRTLGGYFYSEFMCAAESTLRESGQQLIIANGHGKKDQEESAIDFLLSRRCDALILNVDGITDEELKSLGKGPTPFVIVGRSVPGMNDRCILLDNEKGAYLATSHLIHHGHRQIAYVGLPAKMPEAEDRLRGYIAAHKEQGLTYNPELVIESDLTLHGGQLATMQLLEFRSSFTAIVFANDDMAMGGMEVLYKAGLSVPEQVSVVGFDDVAFARHLIPQLTTVRSPVTEMGELAGHLAMSLINDPVAKVKSHLQPELIARASVSAPP